MVAVIIAAALALSGQTPASPGQNDADRLVRQLKDQPSSFEISATAPPDPRYLQLDWLHRQIHGLGDAALPALSRALSDPEVRLKRNVAYFLFIAGIEKRTDLGMDIQPCLPALIEALVDSDQYVRFMVASAIGTLGANGIRAIPALVALLKSADDVDRNLACATLGAIGPVAKEALPALREALDDSEPRVRWQAQFAIEKIQGPQ